MLSTHSKSAYPIVNLLRQQDTKPQQKASPSHSEQFFPCCTKTLSVPQLTMDHGNIPACFLVGPFHLQGWDVV
jgi:hypothetical protein